MIVEFWWISHRKSWLDDDEQNPKGISTIASGVFCVCVNGVERFSRERERDSPNEKCHAHSLQIYIIHSLLYCWLTQLSWSNLNKYISHWRARALTRIRVCIWVCVLQSSCTKRSLRSATAVYQKNMVYIYIFKSCVQFTSIKSRSSESSLLVKATRLFAVTAWYACVVYVCCVWCVSVYRHNV